MKTVILQALILTYFKGIQKFEVLFNGKNAKIYGDNATGKTSLFDAFLWLLFDKDSNNDAKFALKTLDANGNEMHNVEHTVEGQFVVDGQPMTLKKVYKEVYKKTRGSVSATFSGHTTDHYVNGVPVNKKEFTDKVQVIVHEDVFRLLTNPAHFNENIDWKKRREILIELAGDVTDEQVIASDKKLALLNDLLSGKSVDDLKKIIASRKKHINDQLVALPIRIDEIMKSLPETESDPQSLNEKVSNIQLQIDSLMNQKQSVLNGAAIVDKQNQLKQIEFDLAQYKREFESEQSLEVNKLQVKLQEVKGNEQIVTSELRNIEYQVQSKQAEITATIQQIEDLEREMQVLRDEFEVLKQQKFEFKDACECPTCKQALPKEQVQAARDEAVAQYNYNISNQKDHINTEGNRLKERKIALENRITQLNKGLQGLDITAVQTKLESAQKEVAKVEDKLQKAQTEVVDVTTTSEYQSFRAQKAELEQSIQSIRLGANEVAADLNNSIAQLEVDKRAINAELAHFAGVEASRARIAQLEAEQQQLAEEYATLEQQLFLAEEFTRKKVAMLEERINGLFQHATFKLFSEQVNGGLNETCETLYKGVPYGSGLNNAAKINVGLDIINTLSKHYGIQAPIFVDNAEAVTKLIDTNAQMISLVVSEQDKVLRVELEDKNLAEAI